LFLYLLLLLSQGLSQVVALRLLRRLAFCS
jgi:hypothetical protein